MNHGTESGYSTHIQRGEPACDDCREAHRAYHLAWRRRNRTPRLVDAGHTREHLARIVAEGSTLRAISDATGISHTTLKDILRGRAIIQSHTARKILDTEPTYGERIPAAGTARRIQALNAIGWSNGHLGKLLGVSRDRVTQYANAHRVERATAERIAELYDQLAMTPGPSQRARGWAQRRGYLPPLAWDDDTIDDPGAWANVSLEPDDDYADPVVVDRLIAGADWQAIGATRAERVAAAERLAWYWTPIRARQRADGMAEQACDGESLTSIERRFGLRAGRDFRKAPDAEAERGAA